METTLNTYRMADVPDSPTMEGYFNECLTVELSRREIYWLRDMLKKKIEAARQGMNCPNAHPQKKRSRYEEFAFLRGIQERLYGSDPDGAAQRAEYRETLYKQAEELESKAAEIRELYNSIG